MVISTHFSLVMIWDHPIESQSFKTACFFYFQGIKKNHQEQKLPSGVVFSIPTQPFTPRKTNMSPENWCLEDVFPIEIVPFQWDIRSFSGVICYFRWFFTMFQVWFLANTWDLMISPCTEVLPRELTSSVQQLCIERRGEEPFGMDGWGRNFWAPPPGFKD